MFRDRQAACISLSKGSLCAEIQTGGPRKQKQLGKKARILERYTLLTRRATVDIAIGAS